jgi:polyisoprenoid-binding protein YceI
MKPLSEMNAKNWFKAATTVRNCFSSHPKRRPATKALPGLAASLGRTVAASAQQHAIDTGKSVMTVRVYKAGLLSALGHDHEIAALIAGGTVDTAARHVELHVHAASLRVHDPNVSEKDRNDIQKTMLGREVLDVEHYAEIIFRSTSVEPAGASTWSVRGDLKLHEQTKPVTVEVKEWGGHYMGTSRFKQTDFGIKPVKVAGGTIQVKDEVRIEFDIQLAR